MTHLLATAGVLGLAILSVRYLARPAHSRHDAYYLRNWLRGLRDRVRAWATAPIRMRRHWAYLRHLYRAGVFEEDGT